MKLVHNIFVIFSFSIELKDVSGKPWVIHPSGQQPVCFNYNLVGDNTKVYSSVANDWERNYTYDWLGRRLTYTEGELAEYLTYDGSNLATHTQRWLENGQPRTKTTQFHYNAHRLDSVGYDDALTTIYHYDKYGRVDSLYDESGVMCYEYGSMGEVTKETRIYAMPFLAQPIALGTQFGYDSWGRVDSIIYPDNEIVKYQYDCGGQLQRIYNRQLPAYIYLDSVLYDRFGAKTSQKYGNGIKTLYSYNNDTRRLENIITNNGASTISSFTYTYDNVGNVTQVTSSCPWLQNQNFSETFTYDASDQLISASETNSGSYQLTVSYGNWGKITSYSLAQTDLQNNTTQSETQAYTYPATNSIGSSQTLFAPQQRTITDISNNVATETLTFGINGSLRKREVQAQPQTSYTEYYLFNGAANLKAYSNNTLDFAYYGYNATNTRTYKLSMLNMHQWVNGQLVSLLFLCSPKEKKQKERAFAAVEKNPVHNARQLAERRYPLRSHRSAPLPCYGRRIFFITPQVCDMTLTTREIQRLQQWQDATLSSEVPPCNLLFSFLCFVSFFFSGRRKKERNEGKNFYYHTNHLGSTAFVTDQNQNVTQGFLYAPFGEITTEYAPLWQNGTLPKYAFNAKELDEETGMYYYEARYYKPPVFTSRDPHFESYFWTNPYGYCKNNPLKYIDPTGKDGVVIVDDETQTLTIKATYFVQTKGDSRLTYTADEIETMNTEINGFLNSQGYSVTKGQYKGYSVKFDLQFKEGGDGPEAETLLEHEKFFNIPIGNLFNKGDQTTHSDFIPQKDNSVVGGMTGNNKYITMNSSFDNLRNRIHEIFHTLFFNRDNSLKGIGSYYVKQMPNQKDINKLVNNYRLPKIKQ